MAFAAAIASACGCYAGATAGEPDTSLSSSNPSSASTTTPPGTASSTTSATTAEASSDPTTLGTGTTDATTDTTADTTSDTTADMTGSGTDTDGEPNGPMVDLSDPQLYDFDFEPGDADPNVTVSLRTQQAQLDTRVEPQGRLVVYLHGSGTPDPCGSQPHGAVLAGMGFHVLQPCYESNYQVSNCADDFYGCRLEAFSGVDAHDFIAISPPDSIETRVVRGLEYLQSIHPGGDWEWFVVDDQPRWDRIVISGISHGASTSAVIGKVRVVDRVVSLSGPLDSGQYWLTQPSMTSLARFFAFTHTGDDQHAGHLESLEALGILGAPVDVDDIAPPYAASRRLVTSAPTANGHGATQAGGDSPMIGDEWEFMPVWRYMYGGGR